MGIDINAIRGRLNKLQNTQKKTESLWKPTPGKHQVRIVPYKFDKDNPFIELYFHYNINNKTYLSPQSFGRPDPIVEFADKLKRMGDKEDWKAAKQMEPKLRTFVPIIVRGQEGDGVRFWGFGKTVYQEILGYIADPDYGDITDPQSGRDLTIQYISAEEAGASYPTTQIRVKPSQTPLAESADSVQKLLENQTEITDLYSELSYDELKDVLEGWLNPSKTSKNEDGESSVAEETLSKKPTEEVNDLPFDVEDDKPKTSKKTDDVAAAFDDLFNN
jgi:hypothetical protein|tara:strand:- start:5068 stop:5892 length:825 start_codon:yes stop_codon:yes gene_type:complete